MSEFNLYGDGSGNTATGYPKSDNNGSVSDASTIPKDDGHLKEGLEEVAERNQTENPKLARAPTVVKEYCAFDSKWVPPVAGGAPGGLSSVSWGARWTPPRSQVPSNVIKRAHPTRLGRPLGP